LDSTYLCGSFGQEIETWPEIIPTWDFSGPTGPCLGNLVIRDLFHWEIDPYKQSCNWNFSVLVEPFEMMGELFQIGK